VVNQLCAVDRVLAVVAGVVMASPDEHRGLAHNGVEAVPQPVETRRQVLRVAWHLLRHAGQAGLD